MGSPKQQFQVGDDDGLAEGPSGENWNQELGSNTLSTT